MSHPAYTTTIGPVLASHLARLDALEAAMDTSPPHGSMTVSGRTFDVREITDDDCCRDVDRFFSSFIDECFDFIDPIARGCGDLVNKVGHVVISADRAIDTFLWNRLTDCQLFLRAFVSMGYGTPDDIQHSIEVLTKLQTRLRSNEHIMGFSTLDRRADALILKSSEFNFTPEQYIYDDQILRNLRQEYIRECSVAISFQRTLSVVNTFYNRIGLNTSLPPVTTADHSEEGPDWTTRMINDIVDWVDQLVEEDNGRHIPMGTVGTRNNSRILAGTVRYNFHKIPWSIVEKAHEIRILKDQFERLKTLVDKLNHRNTRVSEDEVFQAEFPEESVRGYFKALVEKLNGKTDKEEAEFFTVSDLDMDYMGQIMMIPVFDATHPGIQDQFTSPAVASVPPTITPAPNRDLRHAIDWKTFERQFRSEIRGLRCSICRHPTQHDFERKNMLIDTALQNDILNFLRDRLSLPASTTAVQP